MSRASVWEQDDVLRPFVALHREESNHNWFEYQKHYLGRPLGYLTFSRMALIRDPIY